MTANQHLAKKIMGCAAKRIIAVVGPTAVGKSDFAMALAIALDGEIINSDALQVYRGLDIATNKPTAAERRTVPHHLLDFRDPLDEPYSVREFQSDAEALIEDLHIRGKIPILVGGTHYYLQYLLFGNECASRAVETDSVTAAAENLSLSDIRVELSKETTSSDGMYSRLVALDPAAAERLHENDTRRIRDALRHCRTAIKKRCTNPLHEAVVFWLHEQNEALFKQTVSTRVDRMVAAGLATELASHTRLDAERGLGIAIGWKEFERYIDALQASPSGTESKDESHEKGKGAKTVEELFEQGVEDTKTATLRYARSQNKWLARRLVPSCLKHPESISVFPISASLAVCYQTRAKCIRLAKSFVCRSASDHVAPSPPCPNELDPSATEILNRVAEKLDTESAENISQWKKIHCDVCLRALNGQREWEVHLKTRGHRRAFSKDLLAQARAQQSMLSSQYETTEDGDRSTSQYRTCSTKLSEFLKSPCGAPIEE